MLRRLLARIERVVVGRPRHVVVVALVATLAAAALGAGIELRTSRRELVADTDVPQQQYDALTAELGETQPLILVLETPDPTGLTPAAEAIASRLEGHSAVARIHYRLEPDWVLRVAPWLLDPTTLRDGVAQLSVLLEDGARPVAGLSVLNERLARRLEAEMRTGTTPASGHGATAISPLVSFLELQADFLTEPREASGRLAAAPVAAAAAAAGIRVNGDGIFVSTDGLRAFLFVLPVSSDRTLAEERALVDAARHVVEEVTAEHPDVEVGLTGPPAMTVEEMDTIAADGRLTSAIALAGVTLLSAAAFHWSPHALIGLLVLGSGVIWALAAVRLQVGYLNMITTSMIPILIGLGIDYAVHPISQYEIERRGRPAGPEHGRAAAVRRTFRKTGAPVVVSAFTTAAAFACFRFMEFRGFSELGLVAATGILLCLLASLLMLPALLALAGREPSSGPEPRALVDRVWSEELIERLGRRPGLVVVSAAAVTTMAAAAAPGVGLSSSLLDLLPPTAESLRYLDRVEESSFGTYFNLVLVDEIDELRQLARRAEEHPEIRRVDSIADLLPTDPEAARVAAAELGSLLERVTFAAPVDGGADEWAHTLTRLEGTLSEAADMAFSSGRGEVAAELERARAAAARGAAAAAVVDPDLLREEEARLVLVLEELRENLLEAVRAGAPSPADLPESVRRRFVSPSGRYVGYLFPSANVFDEGFLPRFNAASRAIAPSVVGWPVLFEAHTAGIGRGFRTALLVGGALVVLLLAADLRRASHVALAVFPVVTGVVWMLGAMRLFELSFNLANLVAVPLVIGVGIDAGVHVMHRYRLERAEGVNRIMEHTGRALLVASLTTMVGFGSLMLAHHRGMAGLGALLFLGVGACLLSALVVLPNLLLWLGLAER